MRQLSLMITVLCLFQAGQARAQSVLAANVAPPFPVPMAEGLFRIDSAEPLGKGGFNLRYLNEAYRIDVSKVGDGTSLTGHLGLGYGLANGVDISVSFPLLLDIAGGLTKYGTGDITTAMKFGFPARFPSSVYYGLSLMATHPYGYGGREALNVRPYRRDSREIASRLLFDINKEAVGFRLNAGYLISSGMRQTGLIYGGGVEVGRGQIFTMTAEYWNEPRTAGGRTERAVFGGQMNLWGIRLEVGVEKGISPDLPNLSGMAGLRIHTTLGGKAKKFFGGRVRRISADRDRETTVRVAVVNFSGFEQQGAGDMVADRIRTVLGGYGHVRVVDIGKGTEFLDPDAAMRLAQVSNVDVVITGRVLRYEANRSARPNVPLLIGFPETRTLMQADVRVIDRRAEERMLSAQVTGTGRKSRGLRLFPTSSDDRTSYLNVIEREQVWEEAINQMVGGLFEEMAQTFGWMPG